MPKYGYNLEKIVSRMDSVQHVPRESLQQGDLIYIKTLNSVYTIRKTENNLYEVSGGWFDRKGMSPATMTIRGCSWGGSIINISMVAACGLYLEFGNNLITSPIREIIVVKSNQMN
jgi:hypothetical protein